MFSFLELVGWQILVFLDFEVWVFDGVVRFSKGSVALVVQLAVVEPVVAQKGPNVVVGPGEHRVDSGERGPSWTAWAYRL